MPKFIKKTNDTIPRKRPDKRKARRKSGRTGGRTDRPWFIGPFRLPPMVKQPNNPATTSLHYNFKREPLKIFLLGLSGSFIVNH